MTNSDYLRRLVYLDTPKLFVVVRRKDKHARNVTRNVKPAIRGADKGPHCFVLKRVLLSEENCARVNIRYSRTRISITIKQP